MFTKQNERVALVLLIAITIILNISPHLDIYFAKLFYHPEVVENPWFEKDFLLWKFFYHMAPIISGLILLPAILVYVGSYILPTFAKWRTQAIYSFLTFAIGPGILINTIFKPYWGRPRPRQTLPFNGTEELLSFWEKGIIGNGYSFPCGHSSVGFALIIGYFLFKSKRPKVALFFLLSSIFIGSLMGIGRMADGAHFFSDVMWSAVFSFLPAYFLYYKLQVDKKKNAEFHRNIKKAMFQGSFLLTVLITAVLIATPFKQISKNEILSNKLILNIDKADIEIIEGEELNLIILESNIRGFGLPNNKIEIKIESTNVQFIKTGFFTDIESNIKIIVPKDLNSIVVNFEEIGHIKVPNHLKEKVQKTLKK